MLFPQRSYSVIAIVAVLLVFTAGLFFHGSVRTAAAEYLGNGHHDAQQSTTTPMKPPAPTHPSPAPEKDEKKEDPPRVKYKPVPTWTPPPVQDPFPSLETEPLPSIPVWNQPPADLHKKYGIYYAPPLFIGFTRTWPILLQAVVSYITAGWPASQIYVIENTGVQQANKNGKLTLQNPFYLNHKQLEKLGVNVVQAPVLMNFAQLQNFFIHLSHVHNWPYYFWSHMDVLAMSHVGGMNGVMPKVGEPGYKTVYELSLVELNRTTHSDVRWAHTFFAYDHLTLVNREAYEEVGGWDTFIPYYMTDCDMHARLAMHNWTKQDAEAGWIKDVNTVLADLRALYRDPSVEPTFVDPNPAPPKDVTEKSTKRKEGETPAGVNYWSKLYDVVNQMDYHKQHGRGRNTWQLGQQGGQGEPYYYPSQGIAQAADMLTQAGREVYTKKWGHEHCDLIKGGHRLFDDQWRVEED